MVVEFFCIVSDGFGPFLIFWSASAENREYTTSVL